MKMRPHGFTLFAIGLVTLVILAFQPGRLVFAQGNDSTASSQARITITTFAQVQGENILLKDLAHFSRVPEKEKQRLGAITLGKAPAPGTTATLSREEVKNKLLLADPGLQDYELVIPPRVMVRSAARSTSSGSQPNPDTSSGTLAVNRGDQVNIEVRNGPVTISTTGRALEGGRVGDRIRVLANNRTLQGSITGQGTVSLEMR